MLGKAFPDIKRISVGMRFKTDRLRSMENFSIFRWTRITTMDFI